MGHLSLTVDPEQQRFVAEDPPIAALASAKAYIRAARVTWVPYAIYADAELVEFTALAYGIQR